MTTYLILLRGINVGGKNKMAMAQLKKFLQEQGFENVRTFIQSGNVILDSKISPKKIAQLIEDGLPRAFKLDSSLIRALVLASQDFIQIIKDKPRGFGDHPEKFHSDVIFLLGISVKEALEVFDQREGVDQIWPGKDVIYSQRLSSQRTKSRLGKIIGTKPYQSMTIRSWSTVTKLQRLLEDAKTSA